MNPLFPLNEYIPDGEAHVFGNRVYVYGSHDKARSKRFCVQDYTVWSCPINDLTNWKNHGVSYKKAQDPRAFGKGADKYPDFYAPDCVQGNDGRYYLFYVAMGPNVTPFGPISVAVNDKPHGPFTYLGDIKDKDNNVMKTYLTNDPAVINDNGRIYLYYGWAINMDMRSKLFTPLFRYVQSKLFARSFREIKTTKPSIMGCAVVELETDMLTCKSNPKLVLDSKTTVPKNTAFYHHAFYEAPSIRKYNDIYYLVYSSGNNNELAYATSKYPDRHFTYRGVIISNADLGYKGNKKPKSPAGTIHGSIEKINDEYYIFYHRLTHNTDFSRQACAEKIVMDENGLFAQVEITTSGLSNMPLRAKGQYAAALCCNLYGRKKYKIGNKVGHKFPRIYDDDKEVFIKDVCDKTVIGYKYFNFEGQTTMAIKYRGGGTGKLLIQVAENGPMLAEYSVTPVDTWRKVKEEVNFPNGKHPLLINYKGKGKIDIKEITFNEN